jgi:predicted RNA binding protein YcfA (HicA-like mRNA interferase family)
MRIRFTIRDLLWLAALVALAVGWWIDHRHQLSSHDNYKHNLSQMIPMHSESAVYEGWTDAQVEQTAIQDLKDKEGFGGFGFGGPGPRK